MEGSFQYSPFYPKTSGVSVPSTFKIGLFTNNKPFNELGTTVNSVTFDWQYLNGTPITQSISPHVGIIIPNTLTTFILNQAITETTAFSLQATDGNVNRTLRSRVVFYHPIYYGTVPNGFPTEAEILAMNRRIADFSSFRVPMNIADEHSCFVSPMNNPIVDIRETLFGLSVLGSYNILDNFFLTMADGFAIPCRVIVKKMPEHTSGLNMNLDIIF
jgi:hypothetical protein